MKNFFVYVLQKPIEGNFYYSDLCFKYEPFYVGKGYTDEKYDRMYHTLREGNKHKLNIIKKYKRVEITTFLCESENFAIDLEKDLIKKIGRKDLGLGPLTNMTDGGDGMSGSISLCKKVIQYSKKGDLIEIFNSQKEAHQKTKISNISRACENGILAGEFFWKRVENTEEVPKKIEVSDYFKNRMHDGNKPRRVEASKETESFIFASIKEASTFTKVGSPTIVRSCKNGKVYNGYRFRYKD